MRGPIEESARVALTAGGAAARRRASSRCRWSRTEAVPAPLGARRSGAAGQGGQPFSRRSRYRDSPPVTHRGWYGGDPPMSGLFRHMVWGRRPPIARRRSGCNRTPARTPLPPPYASEPTAASRGRTLTRGSRSRSCRPPRSGRPSAAPARGRSVTLRPIRLASIRYSRSRIVEPASTIECSSSARSIVTSSPIAV